MMVDADLLRIVFRVCGVAFVMPVTDLLAIRGADEGDLNSQGCSQASLQLGVLAYREADVQVYDLAFLFDLIEESQCEEGPLLIFSGADCPWAFRVDQVVGVFDAAPFVFQDLPQHLFRDEFVPYHQVALRDGQLLVSIDAQQLDLAWRRISRCA